MLFTASYLQQLDANQQTVPKTVYVNVERRRLTEKPSGPYEAVDDIIMSKEDQALLMTTVRQLQNEQEVLKSKLREHDIHLTSLMDRQVRDVLSSLPIVILLLVLLFPVVLALHVIVAAVVAVLIPFLVFLFLSLSLPLLLLLLVFLFSPFFFLLFCFVSFRNSLTPLLSPSSSSPSFCPFLFCFFSIFHQGKPYPLPQKLFPNSIVFLDNKAHKDTAFLPFSL